MAQPPTSINGSLNGDFQEGKSSINRDCSANHVQWGFLISMCFFSPRASERRVLPIVGVCKTSSHLHILSLHIFSSSHLLIFTSSHLHILSSSHPLIFTSSHLRIFSSSHLHIFTSSHLHIFSSSHLLILPSSPLLLIFTSSHIFSHLLTSSHIFSHLLIFTSHLTPSPLALSFFSISLLKAGAGAVPTRRHETQPFRTK